MFYFLLIIAIGLPLVAPQRYKYVALIGSMLVLFIPWGLQYEMTQDWPMNLERWTMVNIEHRLEFESGRVIEPLYAYLMTLFFPKFGFFTWLMTCAVIELSVIFYFIRKYTLSSLYWVVLFVLMMNPHYGLLYINSNRQMLSVVFSMFAVILMLYNMENRLLARFWRTIILSIGVVSLIYLGTQIHTGATFAYLLVPVYLYVKNRERSQKWLMLLIFNALYFSRFFLNIDDIMVISMFQVDDFDIAGFESYLEEFSNTDRSYSLVEQPLYFLIMNAAIWFYNELDTPHRFFAICGILGIIGDGFVINTLSRILCYFNIYMLFLIPRLVECCEEHKTENSLIFVRAVYTLLILYGLFMFYKCQTQGEYYTRWADFKTIFSAPHWM